MTARAQPRAGHPAIQGFEPLVEAAATSGVVLVIGASDVGKTTLVTQLASALSQRGASVGVVDADLGQSAIGPPTTVGLGRIRAPLTRLSDAEMIAMHFVGVTSPAANLPGALVGARRMVDGARRAGLAPIVVDTSGLVAGEMGRVLKQAKIELLDPDLVVCLQRADECEPILRPYQRSSRPAVIRLPVHEAVRRRSAEERRRFRDDRLRTFFAAAKPLTLDLTQVAILAPPLFMGQPLAADELARVAAVTGRPLVWAERRATGIVIVAADALTPAEARAAARAAGATLVAHHALADLQDALAGLEDAQHRMIGLGVVKAVDFLRARLVVDASITSGEVAAVSIGREKYLR